ncbi:MULTISPECIES: hypothetical protein [unclassified Bradyrhizobium]|uniref:hypothetical protein n=1 Tax=unclassified Bradyrhizobium TaxID=2631580 RepID=UPI0028E2F98D|nr:MULTISPECIES: hypothetical protein [unclassified Bradyrhizobium]
MGGDRREIAKPCLLFEAWRKVAARCRCTGHQNFADVLVDVRLEGTVHFAHCHSGARPQALNPESRDCLAFMSNKLEIPGSIANAPPLRGFALAIAPE